MSAEQNGWIGVDLDGTLAFHGDWKGVLHIGQPVPAMVHRVCQWLEAGIEVRIVTARVSPIGEDTDKDLPAIRTAIEQWCIEHIGVALPVTCQKDFRMVQLWDDRAVQVIPNTGRRADGVQDVPAWLLPIDA